MRFRDVEADDPAVVHERRWIALALLCISQFIMILDQTVIAIALPSIGRDLHFSEESLSWVVNAYMLTFGGLLLLGGRVADLVGRRRMFVTGLVMFAVASLLGGFAVNEAQMIVIRAVQGMGGAIVSPAALSIVAATFTEGSERNRAMGIWAGAAGSGGAVGVLLGGLLTSGLGWEWVFWINVPVALGGALLAPFVVGESRAQGTRGRVDVAGGITVTAGVSLLVYAIVQAPDAGWGSGRTIGLFVGAFALLALFVLIELRSAEPLVSFRLFRIRSLTVANTTVLLFGAGVYTLMFFLSLYLQRVLGYGPLRAGLAYLPLATGVIFGPVAGKVVNKIGVRNTLYTGLVLTVIGLAWFSRISADGSFVADVLFPSFFIAAGGQFTMVGLTLSALGGVPPSDVGLASGLFNTGLQIGGALGIGVLSTVAVTRLQDVAGNESAGAAITAGYRAGLVGATAFCLVALALALTLMPKLGGPPAATPEDEQRPDAAAVDPAAVDPADEAAVRGVPGTVADVPASRS